MSAVDVLMLAYPRDYRRQRGSEIASTLAEMAPEGRRWPRGRDAVSLLRHGIRARLGRPSSRFIVPFTLLAMLVGGFAAAGAGARVGWLGTSQINDAATSALMNKDVGRSVLIFGDAGSGTGVPGLFFAHDDDLAPAPDQMTWPTASGPRVPEVAAALTRSGWTESGHHGEWVTMRKGSIAVDLTDAVPLGHTYMYLGSSECCPETNVVSAVPGQVVGVSLYRVTPWTVPAAMVVFGLLGAMVTYLLVGWISRRSARLAMAPQRWILASSTVALVFAAPAAIVCAACIWAAVVNGVRLPMHYWAGFSAGDIRPAALVAAVALVVSVGLAVAVRPSELEAPTIAT
ncbi:MAG TPA: hypothetical protein VGJ28_27635 [Micromonosporaceae bacterium]